MQLDQLAHLVQARAHAFGDAVAEGLAPAGALGRSFTAQVGGTGEAALGQVREVRREDGGALRVVAAVDDVGDRVPLPVGGLHRAELVDDQHFGVEHGAQHVHLGLVHRRIERVLDVLEQLAVVVEEAADAFIAHQQLEHADGKMRLPHANVAHEEQTGFVDRILLDEPARIEQGSSQRRAAAGGIEVLEFAMLVARGDVRGGKQAFGAVRRHAVAARDLAVGAVGHGLPPRALAQRAQVLSLFRARCCGHPESLLGLYRHPLLGAT